MLPSQHPPTADPGSGNSPSGEEICRKYIWGTCNKYAQCRFRHELDFEKMKDILRFCHDYQNKNGCSRENCKFLHATKEEQNLFLAKRQLPRVLAERHAAMASNASNTQSNAETIPQIAMFITESYMSQPPPGPWPPLPPPPPQAGLPPVATAPPPPPPASPPQYSSTLQPVQPAQQPLPPPVPTPSTGHFRPAPTTYSAMPSQVNPALFAVNQPTPLVPLEFDASRPPPPLPSHLQPSNNAQLKRKIDANGNAGTSKQRKPEGSELSESRCENCTQRELRINGYKQQMEALHNEEEAQILLYKKKFQEYEIGRDILKTIVGPELFTVFDNLIEQGAQTPQPETPASSFISGSQTMSKRDLLELFQVAFGGGSRNEHNSLFEPVPSTSRVDETLQSLTSITRRHNVASYTNLRPDLAQFVVETLKNNTPSDVSNVQERSNELTSMNRQNNCTNGYAVNGQKPAAVASEPARYGYGGAGAPSQEYGARAHPGVPGYAAPGPSGYASAPATAPGPSGYVLAPAPGPSGYAPAPASGPSGYAPAPAAGPSGYAPAPAPGPSGYAPAPALGPSGYAPAPAPAPYAMYRPAVPPPSNRHYYPQGPAGPGVPNMPYNGSERAPGPGSSQGMLPPATSAAARPGPSNAPHYSNMGRYPQPPFFPPY